MVLFVIKFSDFVIQDDTHKIIWAIGIRDGTPNGNIQKHYIRGTQSILLLSLSETTKKKPADAEYLDILNTNVSLFRNLCTYMQYCTKCML